jgi:GTP cyclohydrolase I
MDTSSQSIESVSPSPGADDGVDEYARGYRREDLYNQETTDRIARATQEVIDAIGEDASREGLADTPQRVARAMQFLTQGYLQKPRDILSDALFEEDYSEIILVRDIELYSLCEHHMLPFFGKAHVGYIPDGKIVGLSKIPRAVDVFSRRLQVQERLTIQIRDAIKDVLEPLGVAVIIEAQHMCMVMRGVEKQRSMTTTSAMSGEFMKDSTRQEFMRLIRNGDS